MCGICGIVRLSNTAPVEHEQLVRMHKSQLHRGPDDSGFYTSKNVGLASQRLAILDLSPRGRMPMSSEDGRFWIVYNGEVYNFRELRKELEGKGYRFKSNTDTEVLLKMYQAYGYAMLDRCNGMFAFAIWDELEQSLFVARDRHGVKPLYYAQKNGTLYFASEQKAIFAAGISPEFDESVWGELLMFRYVAGERTTFKGLKKLLPGHFLTVKEGSIAIREWWTPRNYPRENCCSADWKANLEKFHELFDSSISLRSSTTILSTFWQSRALQNRKSPCFSPVREQMRFSAVMSGTDSSDTHGLSEHWEKSWILFRHFWIRVAG